MFAVTVMIVYAEVLRSEQQFKELRVGPVWQEKLRVFIKLKARTEQTK